MLGLRPSGIDAIDDPDAAVLNPVTKHAYCLVSSAYKGTKLKRGESFMAKVIPSQSLH